MDNKLAVVQDFDTMQRMSVALFESGYFPDVKSKAQAIVKVMAGQELGVPPFASMAGIDVIQGKPRLGANLMASLVDNNPRYDYIIVELTEQACLIDWHRDGRLVGSAGFTMEEAQRKNIFDEIMVDEIEPQLGLKQPVFIYDYPAAMGALARLKTQDRSVAERFELYIGGIELCNGFSELTDPTEQRERFESERQTRRSSAKTVYPMPERFLDALQDIPPAAGNALGIDRLVMLFADSSEIDDVVAFVPEDL